MPPIAAAGCVYPRTSQRLHMVSKRLFRPEPHLDADPARRVTGVAELPADSDVLASLLAGDPAPEVRLAAANRCNNTVALAAAWTKEVDPAVRFAIASALGSTLAETDNASHAAAFLTSGACTDAIRADVARGTTDGERRRAAIAANPRRRHAHRTCAHGTAYRDAEDRSGARADAGRAAQTRGRRRKQRSWCRPTRAQTDRCHRGSRGWSGRSGRHSRRAGIALEPSPARSSPQSSNSIAVGKP